MKPTKEKIAEDKRALLKARLQIILEIYAMASISLGIVKTLHKTEDNIESFVKNQNEFFLYSAQIHWRVAVIELHKLLSEKKNDRYRLSKFLQMLKANKKYFDLSEERISGWEIALQNEREAINCLIELRDKVYAHTDKGSTVIVNTVSLEKCQILIDIVQNVFEDLNNIVFGTSYTFIHFERPKNDLQGIIDVLVRRDKLLEDAEREF